MTPEILDNLPYIAGGLFLVGGALASLLLFGGGKPRRAADAAGGRAGGGGPKEAGGAASAASGRDESRVPGLAILGVIPATDEGQPLLLHRLPANATLAEAYRQVWAQVGVTEKPVLAEGEEVVPRVFAVAGLDGHSGASTTTANLATAAARLGYSVLVVDADLARPSQDELLNPDADPDAPGLAEMLSSGNLGDAADIAQPTRTDGVRLIPVGDVEAGRVDVFKLIPSQPAQRFIRSVAPALAEIVLFDCPPVLSGEPGMEAMCEVEDGVLVVVGADGFDKARLAQAVRWLEDAGGELIGAILVPPIQDESGEGDLAVPATVATAGSDVAAAVVGTLPTVRTGSEVIADAIADDAVARDDAPGTEVLNPLVADTAADADDEESVGTMPDEQVAEPAAPDAAGAAPEEEPVPGADVDAGAEEDVAAGVTEYGGVADDPEEEEEVPARPLFLSEPVSFGPGPESGRRRHPVAGDDARRVLDTIAENESATVFDIRPAPPYAPPPAPEESAVADAPPPLIVVPGGADGGAPSVLDAPAPPTPFDAVTGGPTETAAEETPLPAALAPWDAPREEAAPAPRALEEPVEATEEIAEDGEVEDGPAETGPVTAAELEDDDEAAEAELTVPASAPRLSVSLDDIAFAESFAETFANAPESTFQLSEGETATVVPTESQTLNAPPPLATAFAAPIPPPAPLPAVTLPAAVAAAVAPARRTEMMLEMLSGAEDATTLRATTAAPASAQNPRVTLEITTKRGESLGMRAGTPNAGEDGQAPPDVLLETTTREDAPDAATMRLLVSDAAGGEGGAGEGTVLEASLQKPEAIMIRSGAGQTGEVGVRFEVNSDQSGGTRFRATVARPDEPATYLVEMERTLVEEPLPHATADVPKKQWRNRVSLRTVEKE